MYTASRGPVDLPRKEDLKGPLLVRYLFYKDKTAASLYKATLKPWTAVNCRNSELLLLIKHNSQVKFANKLLTFYIILFTVLHGLI